LLVEAGFTPVQAIRRPIRYTIDDNVLIKTREGATLSAVVVRRKQMRVPQPASLRFTIYVDPPTDLYLAKTAALYGGGN
jgi:uncharacterized protein